MSFCLAASFHTSIDAANDNARVGRWPALLLSARERVGRRGGNERAAACCEVRGGTRASGDGHLLTPIVNRRARSEGNKRASEVVGSGGGDVGKSEDQEWTRKRKVVHERGRVVGAGEGRWAGVASALQNAAALNLPQSDRNVPMLVGGLYRLLLELQIGAKVDWYLK
ncbi:hypothetical protein BD779DRAFT_1469396 [Infundibulicybe gibba]|nr:hypothetical protein BD779DRAFT_1469396 [Infundibulicybe gibba]